MTTQTATSTIGQRAMLIDLKISQWGGEKTNHAVTREVCENHGVQRSAARVTQALFPKNEALKYVRALSEKARDGHYARTLPWLQDGKRILLAAGFPEYKQFIDGVRAERDIAVERFFAHYEQHKADAALALGGLYDPRDYLAEDEARIRFSFEWSVLPIPQASDFRVDLGEIEMRRIERQIEENTRAAIANAQRDAWTRMAKLAGHMAERLAAYKPRTRTSRAEGEFRDTLVTNITEWVEIAHTLNAEQDPEFDRAVESMRTELARFSAGELRESAYARKAIQTKAAALQARAEAKAQQ